MKEKSLDSEDFHEDGRLKELYMLPFGGDRENGSHKGYAFAAIATSIPEVANISPLTILFLTPFGLMEISAYSLGISRSFILIKAIITKTNLLQFIKPTFIEIGIVIALLLAGGYIEFYMIELVENESLEMPGF